MTNSKITNTALRSSNNPLRKIFVAIIYGFAEGEHLGKYFMQELTAAGYTPTQDPSKADIVITHSAGVFYAAPPTGKQLLVCISATYWPGRNPTEQWLNKLWLDIRYSTLRHPIFVITKTFWNIVYLMNIVRTTDIIRRYRSFDFPKLVRSGKVLIIRNTDDPWLTPDLHNLQAANPDVTVKTVAGQHDDCWLNPQPYINLLQSVYEQD